MAIPTQNVQAAPQVRKIADIMAELNPATQPLVDNQNEQLGLVQQQETSDIAGLEQGKINEFRNITNLANRRGVTFSGIPIQEQARYIGEKFLPGIANLKIGSQKERIRIRDIIAGIQRDSYMQAFQTREGDEDKLFNFNSAEAGRAYGTTERVAGQQYGTSERIAGQQYGTSERVAGQGFQTSERVAGQEYNSSENLLDRAASLAGRSSGGGGGGAADATLTKNADGGWDVGGGYDLAGYARATGKDLVTLMSQGDAQDRQAVGWYLEKLEEHGNEDADKYLLELQQDRPTAFYRGG